MRLGLCRLSDKENIKCCHARSEVLYVRWQGKNAAKFLEKVYSNDFLSEFYSEDKIWS